jgi:GTP cyclohydrolase I
LSTLRLSAPPSPSPSTDDAVEAVTTLLRSLGEDPSRPGLRGTPDVAVLLRAAHFCMMMRGIEKQAAVTETSFFTGEFRDSAERRAEFLAAVRSVAPGQPEPRVPGLLG